MSINCAYRFAWWTERDRGYFGPQHSEAARTPDHGFLGGKRRRAIFGRSYAAEPDVLIERLKTDEAIAESRHAAADRAQSARGRLQRACHRGDPETCRAGAGVAVTHEESGTTLREEAMRLGYVSGPEFDRLVRPEKMTHPR